MGPLELLSFDEDDAVEAGAARPTLEQAGAPIGAYYMLSPDRHGATTCPSSPQRGRVQPQKAHFRICAESHAEQIDDFGDDELWDNQSAWKGLQAWRQA